MCTADSLSPEKTTGVKREASLNGVQMTHVLAAFDIPDQLVKGPQTAAELATAVGDQTTMSVTSLSQ